MSIPKHPLAGPTYRVPGMAKHRPRLTDKGVMPSGTPRPAYFVPKSVSK